METIKKIIMYILVIVIVFLMSYLIYFVITYKPDKTTNNLDKSTTKEITPKQEICKRQISLEEFNNYNSIICELTISDLKINNQDIIIKYGTSDEGIYIGNNQIINTADSKYKNTLYYVDNKLFILSTNNAYTDITALDNTGTQVFNLNNTLRTSNITDKTFESLKQTIPSLNTILDYTHIDPKSVNISQGNITFNSFALKNCTKGSNNGTSYTISYTNNTFNNPVEGNTVVCE